MVAAVLLGGEHGQQDAVDRGIDVFNDEHTELIALVVVCEVGRGVLQPDDELGYLEIYRVEQRGDKELPAVGHEPAETLQGEHELRLPADGQPEDRGIDSGVQKLLSDQRPYPEAAVSHRDADDGGEQRTAEGGEEEAAELHRLCDIGLLHVLDAGDDDRQTEHTDDRDKVGRAVYPADKRRSEEQPYIQHETESDIEVENGGIVKVVGVLLLDERVCHAAVDKDLKDRCDNSDEGNGTVQFRLKDAREHDGHDKGHDLCPASLHESPYQIGEYGFLIVVHSLSDPAPIRRSRAFSGRAGADAAWYT